MNDELAATDADIARLDAYIDRLSGALGMPIAYSLFAHI
jgi:hypothetical protein